MTDSTHCSRCVFDDSLHDVHKAEIVVSLKIGSRSRSSHRASLLTDQVRQLFRPSLPRHLDSRELPLNLLLYVALVVIVLLLGLHGFACVLLGRPPRVLLSTVLLLRARIDFFDELDQKTSRRCRVRKGGG